MIYGIGETVLDILFRNDQPEKAIPGGSTFNSMISLGRCGCKCQMITQCGDDHVGDLTLEYLQRNGVSTEGLSRVEGMKSHLSLAFLDENCDAQYSFYKDHRGWNLQLLQEKTKQTTMQAGDILLLGSYFAVNPLVRPAVEDLLNHAQAAGALIYYDMNFRRAHAAELETVRPYIEENIRRASVVRASMDDLKVVYGENFDAEKALPSSLRGEDGRKLLIVSDGAQPIRIYTGSSVLQVDTPPIEPVSTVGAGDNFNAGFIYRYTLSGLSSDTQLWSEEMLLQMVRTGQEFGQEVCMSWENSIHPRNNHQISTNS